MHLGWLENLFDDESLSCLQPQLVEKPFWRRVLDVVASLARWKTFLTTSSRDTFNLITLKNLFDEESSSWVKLWLVGKPCRRRVLHLVAPLACWKTFSMTIPRAGCNLSWLEIIFDDTSSSLLARWKTFSATSIWADYKLGWLEDLFDNESWSWVQHCLLQSWLIEKLFRRWVLELEKIFDDESSSWLQTWGVRTPFRRPVLKLFPTRQVCNQLKDTSSKRFSNELTSSTMCRRKFLTTLFILRADWNLGWLENLFDDESSSFLPCYLVGKSFHRPFFELVTTLAGWKTFSTTSPRADYKLG